MGRDSTTVLLQAQRVAGEDGLEPLEVLQPRASPWLEDSSRKLVTISRIAIAQVCQPLAHRPPNIDCFAASSSR